MAFHDLHKAIDAFEAFGQLKRVSELVSPELEATEINDRMVKNGGVALLFENNGTEFPLLLNMYGSEIRMKMILHVENLDDVGKRILSLIQKVAKPNMSIKDKLMLLPTLNDVATWMPNRSSGRAACQQEMMHFPDLNRLPIPKCWPFDGGKFITLPMVHTQNPETGVMNVGMYRMQVLDSCTTAMHWHLHKDGARHYQLYKKMGKVMPVSVTIGGDPIFAYCASAPMPENIDEYMLAGFLRNERVRLIKCKTNDLYVAADADFVLEGYIDPEEELAYEGPFGDHTGYYSLADFYPKFHITCITHRTEAVYPATIVGVPPQEDRWLGKTTERIFLSPIRITVAPDIIDMNLPYQGGFHNLAIVQLDVKYPGHAYAVMNSLWGAGQMMFNKIMVVVDKDTNPFDEEEVLKALSQVDLRSDILFSKGVADVLDHAGRDFALSGKIGIDATKRISSHPENNSYLNVQDLDNAKLNINFSFYSLFGILLISVNKEEKIVLRDEISALLQKHEWLDAKYIIVFDDTVDISNLDVLLWQVAGNVDPQFDCFLIENLHRVSLIVDATAKRDADGFKRDWPNVIAMDDTTIDIVDEKWPSLGVGEFVHSPSLSIKKMIKNEGPIAYFRE